MCKSQAGLSQAEPPKPPCAAFVLPHSGQGVKLQKAGHTEESTGRGHEHEPELCQDLCRKQTLRNAEQLSRPPSDGLEPHIASHIPLETSCEGCSGIAAWVSLSPRTTSFIDFIQDLTACCHHLCGYRGNRSSTPPPCCSLPLGLTMDPGSLAARSVTWAGSLQLALFLPWAQGTAGRSSGPQLCDSLQAPMAGPAAGWLCAKVTQSLGGQRGAAPPVPRQLSFAMHFPSTGIPVQLFPPMHQLHPSSSGPPKEQLVWLLGVFLLVGQLCSLAHVGGVGWWTTCRKLSCHQVYLMEDS